MARNDLFEVPWCRIAPLDSLDEPLEPILKHRGKSVGGYVLTTPTNGRFSSRIQRENPDAAIVDEYEHLGLVLASLLPETAKRRVRVSVTESGPTTVARLQQRLGLGDIPITEIGQMESAPMSGPFSMFRARTAPRRIPEDSHPETVSDAFTDSLGTKSRLKTVSGSGASRRETPRTHDSPGDGSSPEGRPAVPEEPASSAFLFTCYHGTADDVPKRAVSDRVFSPFPRGRLSRRGYSRESRAAPSMVAR